MANSPEGENSKADAKLLEFVDRLMRFQDKRLADPVSKAGTDR
jgi:hypothetical protein